MKTLKLNNIRLSKLKVQSLLLVSLFLLPLIGQAQKTINYSTQKRIVKESSLLANRYKEYTVIGGKLENKRQKKKYLNLFEDDAKINTYFFLINSAKTSSSTQGSDELTISQYSKKLEEVYPNGLFKNNSNYYIDYQNVKNGYVLVYLEESMRGKTKDGIDVYSKGKTLLKLNTSDTNNIRIQSLTNINSSLRIQNGKNVKFLYFGDQPEPFEEDQVEPSFSYKIALGTNNYTLTQFQSIPTSNLGSQIDITVGLTYLKKLPINKLRAGLGLYYNTFKMDYNYEDMSKTFRSTDQFGNDFQQIITQNSTYSESNRFHNLVLTGILSYNIGPIDLNLSAGPVFNLSTQSEFNSNFTYEAIYAIDENGNIGYTETPTDRTLNMTRQSVQANSNDPVQFFYLMNQEGFNVALDQNQKGSSKKQWNPGFAFNINPTYKFSLDNLSGAIGLEYQSTVFKSKESWAEKDYLNNLSSIDNMESMIGNIEKVSINKIALTIQINM